MHEQPMRPLAGLTVAQPGSSAGAAYCGQLLRRFGATVIAGRGEARRDYERAADEFLGDGKETGDPAGADVVVQDAAAASGEEYRRLVARRPDVVYVVLSPYGATGPLAGAPGVDLNAQALGAMAAVVGNPGEKPLAVPYELAGVSQGLHAAGAVLARLLAPPGRRPSGPIDIAAGDVIASYTRMYTLLYRFYGWPVVRSGRRAPGSGGRYPMTILPCQDGSVVLIGRSRRDWERYLAMMGDPEWSKDPRFQDPLKIATDYADEMDELIGAWLAEHTREELTALAHEYGVPLAAVRTVSEVLQDRQMAHRGFFHTGTGSSVRRPGFPARFMTPDTP